MANFRAAHAWRLLVNTTRTFRRRLARPTLSAVTTVAGLVNPPGLIQPSSVALGIAEILKVPKRNHVKIQEQMDRINKEIESVREEVSEYTRNDGDGQELYLYEAQIYVDKLEMLEEKLFKSINKRYAYGRLFANQYDITETLEACEKMFLDAKLDYIGARQKFYVCNIELPLSQVIPDGS
ncbi:unnamed protein product [Rhizoctonia solani]|uniref:Uncharacterized protein n=1 Tax=Rhizoctonia solani TaxID=456999 RepID=A0A8H3E7N2_9AGAM|nr:unnamed protein product [Rhizoctonia solani]